MPAISSMNDSSWRCKKRSTGGRAHDTYSGAVYACSHARRGEQSMPKLDSSDFSSHSPLFPRILLHHSVILSAACP